MTDAPSPRTQDLFRMLAPAGALRFDGDGRSFSGYAAVWDSPTVINSWEGHFVESFSRGAFTKSVQKQGTDLPFLFDHGMDPSIGNKPIGKLTSISEDSRGLKVTAQMLDRPYAEDITEALRARALGGMSFRFTVTHDDWDDSGDLPVRTVRSAWLHEVSVVTFPAYEATTAGVRGQDAYRIWLNREHPVTDNSSPVETVESDTSTTVNDVPSTLTPVVDHRTDRLEFLYEMRLYMKRLHER